MGNQEHESSGLLTVNWEQTRKEEEELDRCFGTDQFIGNSSFWRVSLEVVSTVTAGCDC